MRDVRNLKCLLSITLKVPQNFEQLFFMAFYSQEMIACIRYTTPRAKVLLSS